MNAHGSKPCVWMYLEEISPIKVLPLWSHWSWGRGRKFWLCLLTEPCFLDVNLQGCFLSLCYFVTVIKHGVAESKENSEKSFVPWITFLGANKGQRRRKKRKMMQTFLTCMILNCDPRPGWKTMHFIFPQELRQITVGSQGPAVGLYEILPDRQSIPVLHAWTSWYDQHNLRMFFTKVQIRLSVGSLQLL